MFSVLYTVYRGFFYIALAAVGSRMYCVFSLTLWVLVSCQLLYLCFVTRVLFIQSRSLEECGNLHWGAGKMRDEGLTYVFFKLNF